MFPRLFHIGSFSLPTYGLLVATGVLIGLWISVRNSEKQGINGDDAWNLGILVVLAGIIGAKILLIINEWDRYAGTARDFSLNTLQSESFSGGLIGAFSWRLVHAAASHAATTHLRWIRAWPCLRSCAGGFGCFSAGCRYGKETHHFWGVTNSQLAHDWSGTP